MAAVLVACSADVQPKKARPRNVAVTAISAPISNPAKVTLGPAGGTLASIDGKVTLTVPANAVTTATDFSVTPIETTSPGGVVSYRLGPEGVKLANKVTITFKYSDADVAGSHPSFLRVAYQDTQRRWRLAAAMVDEGAKTVSTQTDHFSDWSLIRGMQIRPATAVVTVNEWVPLSVQWCAEKKDDQRDEEKRGSPVFECSEYPDEKSFIELSSSVNGIAGGNVSIGRVTKGVSFRYIAPDKPPSPNPVSVSVEYLSRGDDGKPNKTIMVAQVTVIPEDKTAPADAMPKKYSGSGEISFKTGGEGTGASLLTYKANFEIKGGRAPGSSVGEYQLPGMLHVSGGNMELPNCSCSITGGSAPTEAGLGVRESDKTHSLALSAFVTVGLSCTPSEGRRSCPSSNIVAVTWSNVVPPGCSGSAVTSYSNVRELAGGLQRTCGSTEENAHWSLIGE